MLSAVLPVDYLYIIYADARKKFDDLFRAYKAAWDDEETQLPDEGACPRVHMLV